jgi:hypothetical protein
MEKKTMTDKKKYKFEGSIIKITEKQYDIWKKVYYNIPDLFAEISAMDDFYRYEKSKGRQTNNWFIRISNQLNRRHQKYTAEKAEIRKNKNGEWRSG